jgi:deoxyribose-phosphate aldolase
MTEQQQRLAATIDHTILKPEATQQQIATLCAEARRYLFASVCVNPTHAEFASAQLAGSPVKVCTVIGFPLGANASLAKVYETDLAIKHGAREVDMVINIGAVKAGLHAIVERDITAVVEAACRGNALSKVIIETALLTDDEKLTLCSIVTNAGADFIKTSTGFSTGGATIDDVKLMRANIGKAVKVKASGGIRDIQTALAMLAAGAERLGTSSGVALVEGVATTDANAY